jgi:hypothetical protein
LTCDRQSKSIFASCLDAREGADYREDGVDEHVAIDALEIAREALRVVEEYAT